MIKPVGMRWWVALTLGLIVFVLDIASKEAITASFQLHEAKYITTFFNIGFWLNPGAAFSFLSDAGGWQKYFFSAIAIGAIAWLSITLYSNRSLDTATQVAYALIAGGAAGNLYDRIVRGAVVDWIDVHWAGWHWPAFNIADCGIVVGAALVMLSALILQRKTVN